MPARPYMARLMSLTVLALPAAGPLLCGRVTVAMMAFLSWSQPITNARLGEGGPSLTASDEARHMLGLGFRIASTSARARSALSTTRGSPG